jgi:hypothetical protein
VFLLTSDQLDVEGEFLVVLPGVEDAVSFEGEFDPAEEDRFHLRLFVVDLVLRIAA